MITKEEVIQQLNTSIEESGHEYDLSAINHAVMFAILWHDGQFRSSGEEFVCHPLEVARILVNLGMDNESIIAAILHDTVEDTVATLNDIRREFGTGVAELVDGVTKIEKIAFESWEEAQAENIRKILFALSKDARVIIIKLADRVHNMRTIDGLPEKKRLIKARETMDVYAPIAHRLGMENIKDELEDLSLRTLDPIAYKEIEDYIESRAGERKSFLDRIQDKIRDKLVEYGIENPTVTGRLKSIASTYRKTFIQGRELEEIYDVFAVRIIVKEVTDCYNALGVVHDLFRPIPGRFKDYISTPKANMYQSLHTTVIGQESVPFEIQIRTQEMHYTAEYGIAAHWKYKAGIAGEDSLDERLNWVRHFVEIQQEGTGDAEEFVQNIKTDLSPDEVIAFTPKGDTISLPNGSTVIDFAYAIHSAVGNRMVGAKVDNRIVPLDYQVQSGQIVEILTTNSPDHGPSRDWLNVVKTGEARTKIRSWFKKERREENITQGKAELEREISRNLIHLPEQKIQELLENEAKRLHFSGLDDFYAAIGYGGLQISRLIPHLKDAYVRILEENNDLVEPEKLLIKSEDDSRSHGGVIVDDIRNCAVKFAKCCNPLPGDQIIGFITKMGTVSVHNRNCNNVPKDIQKAPEPTRWVSCHWENSQRATFNAALYIRATDRQNLLADILGQLSNMHLEIKALSARNPDIGDVVIDLTIAVNSVEHLKQVITKLRSIPSITDVQR